LAKKPRSRILVVDDDENIRKVLASILEEKDYVVDQAETGAEAIAKTAGSNYDLMLIDIRLPDMVGIELLTKTHETTPRTRKIIMTGYPTLKNAIAAVNKGADAYIMKPFEMDKMLQTIKEQLEKQKQERKISEQGVADFIQTRVREINSKEE